MESCIKGGVIAGIVLFIWTAISWMVLPWHMNTLSTYKDETAVIDVIKTNAPKSGIYFLPMQKMNEAEQTAAQPMIFTSIRLEGVPSMTMQMATGLICEILTAILVGWLLTKTAGLGYFQRVGFVMVFAIAVSIIAHVTNWNWMAFDLMYTLVQISDVLIGWFLAGLILAKFCKR